MNGKRYQKVPEEHLLPFMGIHGRTHFLQNGTACHASKHIKVFLVQQNFQVIDWPGHSPHLSPKENCWNHMKNLLKKKDTSLVPKLTSASMELWTQELTIDY